MTGTRYSILGPLEVHQDGRAVEVRRERPRSLLVALLLRAGEPVSTIRLVDDVWGAAAPASADRLVRLYVWQLRKELGGDVVVTTPSGYRAAVGPGELDAVRFESLAAEGDRRIAVGRPDEALELYREALALWRGPAAADAPLQGDAAVMVRRLDELRLHVLEQRFDTELRAGRHVESLAGLERAVIEQPLREPLVEQLMLALYRAGRQGDALEVFRRTQRRLDEELGLRPGPRLQRLQKEILRQDPALDPPAPRHPTKRTRRWAVPVTVLTAAILAAAIGAIVVFSHRGKSAVVGPSSVLRLDSATGHLQASVRLQGTPGALIAAGPHVWVVDTQHATLDELDATNLSLRASDGVDAIPHALAYDGRTIWAADGFVGTLSRIDPDGTLTPSFKPEPTSTGRLALAYGAGTLWVGSQDGAVTRLVTPAARTVAIIRGVAAPEAIALTPTAAWIAQATSVDLLRIDPHTNHIVHRIPLGGVPTALAVADGDVWALTPAAGVLWRVNPRTNAVTGSIQVSQDSSTLATTNGTLWIASAQTGILTRIDPSTNAPVQTMRLGHPIGGMAASTRNLYITTR